MKRGLILFVFHIETVNVIETRSSASLPFAFDDSTRSQLKFGVPPTLEELRPVHDQVSNSINVSVAILPAAFYRLENTALKIFCIGSIKTKATS